MKKMYTFCQFCQTSPVSTRAFRTMETTFISSPYCSLVHRFSTGRNIFDIDNNSCNETKDVHIHQRFDYSNLARSATFGKQSNPTKEAVISHVEGFRPNNSPVPQSTNVCVPKKCSKPAARRKKTPREYICEFCGRKFSKSYNLMIHARTHTDERPFSCNLCNKQFRRSDHLRDHKYIHAKEKPFKCKECGKGFCQSRTLMIHYRTHSLTKEFENVWVGEYQP